MKPSLRNKTICFFFAIVLGSATGDAAEIRLKKECACPDNLVLLSDVANVIDSDQENANKLGGLVLFPAPTELRILQADELRIVLRLKSVDLSQYQITGSSIVRIRRGKGERIHRPFAKTNFTTNAKTSKPKPEPDEEPEMAVFAIERVDRGQVITAQHVELRPAPLTGGIRDLVYRVKDVVGKEASRSILPDRPISKQSYHEPILVRRREQVVVTAVASGILVKGRAMALNDGTEGQTIEVQTLEKNPKRYTARVVGFREVEVYASGPRVGPK